MNQQGSGWKLKDVRRLINSVKTLKLEIPPKNDPEWANIDRFLNKPGKFVSKCFPAKFLC